VPHLQDPDRVAAARIAIDELETQLIVLDDGFQHRRLARDLDLVLIDATEPFGYDHVFPRGMLREPVQGLARADVVALTRCNLVSNARREELRRRLVLMAPQAIQIEVAQRPQSLLSASGHQIKLDELPSGPLLAFCGIGNPAAFRQMLVELGWHLEDFLAFPDHHPFDPSDITRLHNWMAEHPNAQALICTHKDLVKIDVDRLGNLPLYALTIALDIEVGQEQLEARLQNLLSRIPTA
jgi:tetraacyldisaccharide 4'-kinase